MSMSEDVLWRIITDYTGAGRFVLHDDHVVVGTDSGVECVPRGGPRGEGWKAEFGSRCLGVREVEDRSLLATCRGGLLLLSEGGEEQRERMFAEQLVGEAVPWQGGLLVPTGAALLHYRDWKHGEGLAWRFRFQDALGESVESVRLLNLFPSGDRVVCGVVDYDSGVGRVIVLDGSSGRPTWMSDPGPVSEVFPAPDDRFVWCLTGYGRFETHCTRLDGETVWSHDAAGLGAARADGSVVLIAGSNESPQWDHWRYRCIAPDGSLQADLEAQGRAPVRPLCHEDGSTYFVGYVFYLDPSSSRVDYTNFFAMPQELWFQHLIGLRKQIPEYDVFLQRVPPDGEDVETLFHIQGSFSLAEPRTEDGEVVFCDGCDIIAVPR